MFRNRAASLALVGLLAWSSACTKWVPLEPPYSPSLEEYGKLRITNERGVPVELNDPRLAADSVRGTVVTSHWERGDLRHSEAMVAIPLESVHKVEKRGTDVGATLGLLLIPAAMIGLAGIAMKE